MVRDRLDLEALDLLPARVETSLITVVASPTINVATVPVTQVAVGLNGGVGAAGPQYVLAGNAAGINLGQMLG